MRIAGLAKGALTLATAGGAAFYVLTMPATLPKDAFTGVRAADAKAGETMFNAGGCASCHATPGQDDKKKLGGGLAMHTPFGTFSVPNISPDPKAGIGAWSDQQFADAMMKGVGRNGEHLYPAFPYTSYQRMSLADVRDMFAYIKTLPAIPTAAPPHDVKFPFSVRRGLGLWKLLYLDGKPFTPDPKASNEVNRGAYLVTGPGHCGECHTPRNAIGGFDTSKRLAGGPDPEGKGWVPNITPHPDGLAKWSAKDIAYFLETGFNPDYDAAGGSMADVVLNTGKLTPEDRNAMAAYLKSIAAIPGKSPSRKKAE